MECKKYYFVYHGKIIGGKIAKSFGEIFRCAAIFFIVGLGFIISLVTILQRGLVGFEKLCRDRELPDFENARWGKLIGFKQL